ncbi:hypothetical protein BDN72DRAFT_307383 [Pluteus cervinus]|uniref:Uncharacterized protein n=1 Tax=Pluteus cervinus TaxID=181527 RepID=A0ACD3AD27_9AGAR|nr:hypothetical protein BDN72DRAFT_307383 [Pluteus cervinus]
MSCRRTIIEDPGGFRLIRCRTHSKGDCDFRCIVNIPFCFRFFLASPRQLHFSCRCGWSTPTCQSGSREGALFRSLLSGSTSCGWLSSCNSGSRAYRMICQMHRTKRCYLQ